MVRFMLMLLVFLPVAVSAAGDPAAGEAKSGVCAACHGMDGNSAVSAWPKIAGQHEDYIARQTRMVRDQQRNVPEMYPMVMNLSDQDIADIAAYFASQTLMPGVADEALVELGRQIYHGGNADSGVPACAACHGPAGSGVLGANYPVVQAQHADYTASRLTRYRDGETNGENDPYSRIMVGVATNLTDEEINAVSSYIEGLHMARWQDAAGN
ncbi:c-type cytochrome [Wenzhouxiangella marina]|nr:c-type cytochrome [Wenzhouxiangella marina]MBB6087397.1 cytochrome c553 [Wenzhouxiangella marina]